MKGHGHKIRILIGAFLFVIIISIQLPFCKISQIGTTYVDTTFYESILQFEARIPLYTQTFFLTKGKTYHNIIFSDHRQYNIKFGWDNSITLTSNDKQYRFEVDSLDIAKRTDAKTVKEMYSHIKADSVYTYIGFYDGDNYFVLFRQKNSMRFKGKREGFEMYVNGRCYKTGKSSFFDY